MVGAVTENEKKRAAFVLGYMQTQGDERAKCAAGRAASGAGYHEKQRIMDCLEKNQSLRDSSRPGPIRYYDDDILQQAEDMLLDDATGMLTGQELYRKCREAGILRDKSDKDFFLEKLKEYVAQHGHKLNTSSRASTFFLAKSDIKDRVKFCREMLATMQQQLHSLVFVDETTIEESSHPKGKHAWHGHHEKQDSIMQLGGCLLFHANLIPYLHSTTAPPHHELRLAPCTSGMALCACLRMLEPACMAW
jgi:hypothetical protein